jgi:hypothetical protein
MKSNSKAGMLLRTVLPLVLFALGFVLVKDVQAGNKYAPFTMNEEMVTATLSIKDSPLKEKYKAIFARHNRNSESTIDWVGVIELIVGVKDPDLYLDGTLSFESNDETVKISSSSRETLEKLLGIVRPMLATPQKVDSFLSEQEAQLNKNRK